MVVTWTLCLIIQNHLSLDKGILGEKPPLRSRLWGYERTISPPLPPQYGPRLLSLLQEHSRTSILLNEALDDGNIQRFRNILDSGFEQTDLVQSMHAAIRQNLPDFVSETVNRGFPIGARHAVEAIQHRSKDVLRTLRHLAWDINEPLSRFDPPALG